MIDHRFNIAFAAPIVAFALLLTAAPTFAQTQKPAITSASAIPPLGPPHALKLPGITAFDLPNGLHVYLLEDHRQPAVWIRLAIHAGSIRDPEGKVGLASLAASMLDQGTSNRSESQIAEQIDGIGGELGAASDDDYLTVMASGLSSQTTTLMDLVSDVTLNPTFPDIELDRLRTRTLSSIQLSLGDAATLAEAAFDRTIYGSHPYGNFSSGTPQTVPKIESGDLKTFHDTYFVPNESTLFLVGDLDTTQARDLAAKSFGAWIRKETPPLPPAPRPMMMGGGMSGMGGSRLTLIDRTGAAQTEIRIGTLTPGYKDPKRIVATVATAVLGLGQFEGRLTREIRVKRGLTYGAESHFVRREEAGAFQIGTYTKNSSTGKVIQIALDQADKLARELTPEEELQARKDFLLGSFAVSVATPGGVLGRLMPAVLYGDGADELNTYTERVQAVTPDDIRQEMAELLRRPLKIVLVGDAKEIAPQLQPFSRVITTIPFNSVDLNSPNLRKSMAAMMPKATSEELAEGRTRLDAIVKAHGGDAFLNVKSIVFTGKGEMSMGPGGKAPVSSAVITIMPPNKTRLDAMTTFGNVTFATTGNGGWVNFMGTIREIPPGAGGMMSGVGDPTALLRNAVSNHYEVRSVPDALHGKPVLSSDNKPLKGIAITDANGRMTRIYFDPDSHLTTVLVNDSPSGGDLVTYLSDMKTSAGVTLPASIRILDSGNELFHLTFDKIDVNGKIEADPFAKPDK